MWEDPLVEEIRKRRREILAEYDNDISKLIDDMKNKRKEYSDRLILSKRKKKFKIIQLKTKN